MPEKVLLCWSSGKDSAMALYVLRQRRDIEVVALLTTITEDYDRVSMHGVRRVLVEQQARSIGLPLEFVRITKDASNEDYEEQMRAKLLQFKAEEVRRVAFGDIFLEDLRKHREENLAQVGMTAMFPIWKRDTRDLAHRLVASDFKAVITCVDTQALDGKFAGRAFDESFLAELPPSVDPCGENGEYHSFVYDGPIFATGIACKPGEVVLRNGRFCYCDMLPASSETAPA